MRAQVSFGSQFQKCPQACFAHIAPESIPKVRNAVPIYIRVSAEHSSFSLKAPLLNNPTKAIRKAQPIKEYENI